MALCLCNAWSMCSGTLVEPRAAVLMVITCSEYPQGIPAKPTSVVVDIAESASAVSPAATGVTTSSPLSPPPPCRWLRPARHHALGLL